MDVAQFVFGWIIGFSAITVVAFGATIYLKRKTK